MRGTVSERLAAKTVAGPGGCRLFSGSANGAGYGQIAYKGKPALTHRVAWLLVNGPIPKGKLVLHRCDVKLCVNPDHLFLGTYKDNVDDMLQKGRGRNPLFLKNKAKTHCVHGHILKGRNLGVRPSGTRYCLECNRITLRKKAERLGHW